MIRSMTAFSRIQAITDMGELTWELRSVNHRYLETHIRLPEELRAIEPDVRDRLAKQLGRGKVECNLRFKPSTTDSGELKVNDRLADQVLHAANIMASKIPGARTVSVMDILRWPGVLEAGEQDYTPLQKIAMEQFQAATGGLVESREREGVRLAEHISQRCSLMREQVDKARKRMPEILANVKNRIKTRLQDVSDTLDQDRLEQEMALLAQRLDVDEEMDRLNTHLDEVENVLTRDEPVGRRLDFLMQELNREANTLGSKSADSSTTAISVEMKVLIEQMREQVQNLE